MVLANPTYEAGKVVQRAFGLQSCEPRYNSTILSICLFDFFALVKKAT